MIIAKYIDDKEEIEEVKKKIPCLPYFRLPDSKGFHWRKKTKHKEDVKEFLKIKKWGSK